MDRLRRGAEVGDQPARALDQRGVGKAREVLARFARVRLFVFLQDHLDQSFEVCAPVRNHGVILRPLGDLVVWMPPLTMTAEDLQLLEGATTDALRETLG